MLMLGLHWSYKAIAKTLVITYRPTGTHQLASWKRYASHLNSHFTTILKYCFERFVLDCTWRKTFLLIHYILLLPELSIFLESSLSQMGSFSWIIFFTFSLKLPAKSTSLLKCAGHSDGSWLAPLISHNPTRLHHTPPNRAKVTLISLKHLLLTLVLISIHFCSAKIKESTNAHEVHHQVNTLFSRL